MTTTKTVFEELDAIDQAEAQERAKATKRYWRAVHDLADPKVKLDAKAMNALRDDLRSSSK